jgi:glutamyl endopeptidase
VTTTANRASRSWRAAERVAGYRLPRAARSDEAASAQPLDAWFASFPDAALMSGWSTGSMEVIFGNDDRAQVTDTTTPPFCWIAFLEIDAADGTVWRGTGWLASPGLIVTAGHCVYLSGHDGWASSIKVTPGYGTDEEGQPVTPAGSQVSQEFRTTQAWLATQDEDWDYGAILLPQPLDADYGHFSFTAASDAELSQAVVNIDGYPGDKPPDSQWYCARRLTAVNQRTLQYTIDTVGGDSGAPLYVDPSDRTVVGIHTQGLMASNEGVRITADVAANLSAWIADAAGNGGEG